MGTFLDTVPLSGIIRIRDMMYDLTNPFRLDQGDVSFDVPESVRRAMVNAIAEGHTHYLQTAGLPRLRELITAKLRERNGLPVGSADEVLVTTGGIHGLFVLCQALLEPGDEVIVPDPEWPPCMGNIQMAHGVPVACPLRESMGWRWDLGELASKITSKTRAIYLNSPGNPTGGVFTRDDLTCIADIAARRGLWIISDEAYEDIIYDGAEHVSIGSLPGLYERTISIFTFSKSFAMTGLRLGYVVAKDTVLLERMKKALFYTASNIASVVQWGGVGALEGPRTPIEEFRVELQARRDLFFAGMREAAGDVLTGEPPQGAFYAFMRISPDWWDRHRRTTTEASISWAFTEHLVRHAKIGCVPGVDFGPTGEGYVRFCFARSRQEIGGALEAIRVLGLSGSRVVGSGSQVVRS